MARYTRESISAILRDLAAELGQDTLVASEVKPRISLFAVIYHFGSLRMALEESGLKARDPRKMIAHRKGIPEYSREGILDALRHLAAELGRDRLLVKEAQARLPHSQVRHHFGSFRKALEEAGLMARRSRKADTSEGS